MANENEIMVQENEQQENYGVDLYEGDETGANGGLIAAAIGGVVLLATGAVVLVKKLKKKTDGDEQPKVKVKKRLRWVEEVIEEPADEEIPEAEVEEVVEQVEEPKKKTK